MSIRKPPAGTPEVKVTPEAKASPEAKVTPEAKTRKRGKMVALANNFDFQDEAVLPGKGRGRSVDQRFVQQLNISWANRKKMSSGIEVGSGRSLTVPADSGQVLFTSENKPYGPVIMALRDAATHLQLGCAIRVTVGPADGVADGAVKVSFAARTKRRTKD